MYAALDDAGSRNFGLRSELRLLLLHLAANHSVLHEAVGAGTELSASSPDELALVSAAEHFGYEFTARDLSNEYDSLNVFNICTLLVRDKRLGAQSPPHAVQILAVFPYVSSRKRMSSVVRLPSALCVGGEKGGAVYCFCKVRSKLSVGADSVLLPLLAPPSASAAAATANSTDRVLALKGTLEAWADEALRTLVFACRRVPDDEYKTWARKYARALEDPRERAALKAGLENAVDNLQAEIEKGLLLQGGSAVEDELQVGVPETLRDLSRAGIKVWMLTGDKVGTAKNIAAACSLLPAITARNFSNSLSSPHPPHNAQLLRQPSFANKGRVIEWTTETIGGLDDVPANEIASAVSARESMVVELAPHTHTHTRGCRGGEALCDESARVRTGTVKARARWPMLGRCTSYLTVRFSRKRDDKERERERERVAPAASAAGRLIGALEQKVWLLLAAVAVVVVVVVVVVVAVVVVVVVVVTRAKGMCDFLRLLWLLLLLLLLSLEQKFPALASLSEQCLAAADELDVLLKRPPSNVTGAVAASSAAVGKAAAKRVDTRRARPSLRIPGAEASAEATARALDFALVVDEKTIDWLTAACPAQFAALTLRARAVIACRCRQEQKAQMVRLVREHSANARVLAIGDGANDPDAVFAVLCLWCCACGASPVPHPPLPNVTSANLGELCTDVPVQSMIRAAHVGVGIAGKEGMQAVQNAERNVQAVQNAGALFHAEFVRINIC
ncbi:hypothetical protein T492DRAFT_835616 [Pavlovales sp. CCMP2436]|nr:hypothetical protein T492DRAFT_835616 [Pavlovales sp. CCMP2436]